MKIRFRAQGGAAFFPGLAAPVEIDSGSLPSDVEAELREALAEARFFDRAESPAVPNPRARDHRSYELSVESGGRRRSLTMADPIPGDLQRLFHLVTELTRRQNVSQK